MGSNSALISGSYTDHGKWNPRNHAVDTITPHHCAANTSFQGMINEHKRPRDFSCNYFIQTDGQIFLFVPEDYRSWCSSSPNNDHRAITIEVANDMGAPSWHISDAAMASLLNLMEDICRRRGISKMNYTGDTRGNMTKHSWFWGTECPGPYLGGKFPEIAAEINRRLGSPTPSPTPTPSPSAKYKVQIGAFKEKKSADAMAAQAKAKGFDVYVAQDGGLYKVQLGAFNDINNAKALGDKAKAAGFDVYIAGVTTDPTPAPAPAQIVNGSKVRVHQGALFEGGVQPIPEVYQTVYTVMEPPVGDRVVIGLPGLGTTGAFNRSALYLA